VTARVVKKPDERVNVLGVGVHPIDMQGAISLVRAQIIGKTKGYICLAGVHGVMEAQRDRDVKGIFSKALLVAPDGMPTVWVGHLQGFHSMKRVFGPELMVEVIGGTEFRDCVHFFCGGEPGVAEMLRSNMLEQFPWAKIVGTYSPPFRVMTDVEERKLFELIHSLQPDIIWVGLSTPKQERFMAHYLPTLDTKLMIGVGAAFLFHTGAIRDSPRWVKNLGMQWLHRLFQEPSRLWKRYFLNIPIFVFCSLLQIIGLKRYTFESDV
jgi:N-acetylglucosaminyldiphosphoundecaprenol N-acetyl-beta-D-mannosaminyltransferase